MWESGLLFHRREAASAGIVPGSIGINPVIALCAAGLAYFFIFKILEELLCKI